MGLLDWLSGGVWKWRCKTCNRQLVASNAETLAQMIDAHTC